MFDSMSLGTFIPSLSSICAKLTSRLTFKDGIFLKGFMILRSGSRSGSIPNCSCGCTFMRHIYLNFFRTLLSFVSEKLTNMSKSALSPHVKQSEKKILNPDSDPDQQNSAKLFKSPHKEAAYKISSPSDCKLQRRRRLKFL